MNTTPPNIPPPYYEEDEITLKELILKLQEFGQEVWRNILWVIVAGSLLGGVLYWRTREQPTTYTAGLTFMLGQTGVPNDKGSELSAFLATFNQPVGRGSTNKVVELARSGRIINQILLEKVKINEEEDYLANHLIDLYGFKEKWAKEPIRVGYEYLNLKGFYFSNDLITDFSTKEHRALNTLREFVAGNNLTNKKGAMSISYDKLSDIYRLEVLTKNELISLELVETIYEELKAFYIEETVGRPRRNLISLQAKTDSLLAVVDQAESRLVQTTARRRDIISNTAGLEISRLNRNVTKLNGLYTQAYDQKQRLEYALSNYTPNFQVIDQTFIPIKDAPSKLKNILIGVFLGGFLSIGFIIGRKIIRDALA